jgi:hypothetical protein
MNCDNFQKERLFNGSFSQQIETAADDACGALPGIANTPEVSSHSV